MGPTSHSSKECVKRDWANSSEGKETDDYQPSGEKTVQGGIGQGAGEIKKSTHQKRKEDNTVTRLSGENQSKRAGLSMKLEDGGRSETTPSSVSRPISKANTDRGELHSSN